MSITPSSEEGAKQRVYCFCVRTESTKSARICTARVPEDHARKPATTTAKKIATRARPITTIVVVTETRAAGTGTAEVKPTETTKVVKTRAADEAGSVENAWVTRERSHNKTTPLSQLHEEEYVTRPAPTAVQ